MLEKLLKMQEKQGLNEDLIDEYGFPRENIDFMSIKEFRETKLKINQKLNDHKRLLE